MKFFVDLCPFRIISIVRIDVERDMALTFNALDIERVLYQVHLTKPPVFELMVTTNVLKFGSKSCLLSIRNIKKVALFKKFRWVCSAPAWFGGDLVPSELPLDLFRSSLPSVGIYRIDKRKKNTATQHWKIEYSRIMSYLSFSLISEGGKCKTMNEQSVLIMYEFEIKS